MKILQVNKYFYVKGGAERYFFGLADLLKRKGHEVAFFSMQDDKNIASEWGRYFVKNIDYDRPRTFFSNIALSLKLLYSREAEKKMARLIDDFKPDIAHLHNFHHQLTPSILFALRRKRIPVVMTVDDYKLVCPSYLMIRHGAMCRWCRNGRFFSAIEAKCHKNSAAKSVLVALESYLHHSILHSYRSIRAFICPSRFVVNALTYMGLKGPLVYLPYLFDESMFARIAKNAPDDRHIVFWGRLSKEKGVMTLLRAVKGLDMRLTIVGSGPLEARLSRMVAEEKISNVRFVPHTNIKELVRHVSGALAAVVPSEWYEVFGLVILEAYALGMPVIASRIGAIQELVEDGTTGVIFEPGSIAELREKIEAFLKDPSRARAMGEAAKRYVAERYDPEAHYASILDIYTKARERMRR